MSAVIPIYPLGHGMQTAVVGYLRKSRGLTRLKIDDDGVQLPKMAIANGLEQLVDGGWPSQIHLAMRRPCGRADPVRREYAKVTEMVMRLEKWHFANGVC